MKITFLQATKSIVLFTITSLVLVSGCAKPPLEDIASAEAALQAAREAEAPKFAPDPYGQAENLMTETYRLNDNKDYENARKKAGDTREKADEARDRALRARAQGAKDETANTNKKSDPEHNNDGNGGRIDVNDLEQTKVEIESEQIGAGAMDDGSRLESLESVMFGFDEYAVSSAQMKKVEAVSDWLQKNPSAAVKIEGHTDERGAADYNLSLGAKRADSVKQILITLGVDGSRIRTQSFGEETPANPDHDAQAWAENRRADFVVNP